MKHILTAIISIVLAFGIIFLSGVFKKKDPEPEVTETSSKITSFSSEEDLTCLIKYGSVWITGVKAGWVGGNIVIPEEISGHKVTAIDEGAFKDQKGLVEIKLPSTITQIEDNAFSGCTGLKLITLPVGITSIGNNAFAGVKMVLVSSQGLTPDGAPWGAGEVGLY